MSKANRYTIICNGRKYGPMSGLQARDMLKVLGGERLVYKNDVPVVACRCGYLGGAIRRSKTYFEHRLDASTCDICGVKPRVHGDESWSEWRSA